MSDHNSIGWREQPPPPMWSRPDAGTRTCQALTARQGPLGPGQSLSPRCNSPIDEGITPCRPPPPRPPPGSNPAERRATGPPQPRWGPNGPRSGLGGRRQPPAPPRRPTANGRTAASRATVAHNITADGPHRRRPRSTAASHHHPSMGGRTQGRADLPPPALRGRGPTSLAGGSGRNEERT